MIVVGEDSVHLAVQLLEVVLDGVGLQCVIASISTQEVVACKTRSTTTERLHKGNAASKNHRDRDERDMNVNRRNHLRNHQLQISPLKAYMFPALSDVMASR